MEAVEHNQREQESDAAEKMDQAETLREGLAISNSVIN